MDFAATERKHTSTVYLYRWIPISRKQYLQATNQQTDRPRLSLHMGCGRRRDRPKTYVHVLSLHVDSDESQTVPASNHSTNRPSTVSLYTWNVDIAAAKRKRTSTVNNYTWNLLRRRQRRKAHDQQTDRPFSIFTHECGRRRCRTKTHVHVLSLHMDCAPPPAKAASQ